MTIKLKKKKMFYMLIQSIKVLMHKIIIFLVYNTLFNYYSINYWKSKRNSTDTHSRSRKFVTIFMLFRERNVLKVRGV